MSNLLIFLAMIPGGCVGFALRGWLEAREIRRVASQPVGEARR